VDRLYSYVIEFDRPFTACETLPKAAPDEKAPRFALWFDLSDGTPLLVRIGYSTVDVDGARIETPLGGDGWKLWLDKKAEYKSDQLHLNPADAAKIRANAGDWLTPVDVRALSVAGPGCGWDRLFAKSVP